MKNRKITQMLLYFPLIITLLVGCTPKNEGEVLIPLRTTTPISSENYTLPLTYARFDSFISGKRSFILYAMSPTCGACKKLAPRLEYYVKKTKTEIYMLNTQGDDFKDNSAAYINALNLTATPTIYIFEKGQISNKVIGLSEFENNNEVINFFGERIKRGFLFIIDEHYQVTSRKKSVTFSFNFNSNSAQTLFNETFYPLINEHNFKTYLRDDPILVNNIIVQFNNDETEFTFANISINSEEAVTYIVNYFQ